MTITVKRLLRSVVICLTMAIVSFGSSSGIEAQRPSPGQLAGPIRIEQQGDRLNIFYPRSLSQRHYQIYHAVWSEEKGQDDLIWHLAGSESTSLSLSQHRGQGLYHVHTYINIKGRMVGLQANRFQVQSSALTSSVLFTEAGFLEVRVNQVPDRYSALVAPTWSEHKGQDDIRWYSMKASAQGSFSLRVALADHNSELGNYHTHIYGINRQTGQREFLTSQTFRVEQGHLPKRLGRLPNFRLDQIATDRGSYQLRLEDRDRLVQTARLAVWSQGDQSNLKWYHLNTNDGQGYQAVIDLSNHQGLAGLYHNHLYISYKDGSQTVHALETVDFRAYVKPVEVTSYYQGGGKMAFQFQGQQDPKGLVYAVWSDSQGQDDLKWYTIPVSGRAELDLSQHSGDGLYHLHAYYRGNSTSLAAVHHFQVTADMRITQEDSSRLPSSYQATHQSNNTYPIGECTWGVKELAPWVGNYWGNAKDWYPVAQSLGFEVGTEPRVGAVAVWPEDGRIGQVTYGHVAVVSQVNSPTQIQVEEANYAGQRYVSNFRGWFNPQQIWLHGRYVNSPVYYIYPKL